MIEVYKNIYVDLYMHLYQGILRFITVLHVVNEFDFH
jgi:hypothetical protein